MLALAHSLGPWSLVGLWPLIHSQVQLRTDGFIPFKYPTSSSSLAGDKDREFATRPEGTLIGTQILMQQLGNLGVCFHLA